MAVPALPPDRAAELLGRLEANVHRVIACILRPMPAPPKDKSAARDPVSLVVALGLVLLTAGGILAIFSAPLAALIAR